MRTSTAVALSMTVGVALTLAPTLAAQTDPGPRGGRTPNGGPPVPGGPGGGPPAGVLAGMPIQGLSGAELQAFDKGRAVFAEISNVENGLGPRFNLDSCGGCHSQPAPGGSSPAINPQPMVAAKFGAVNHLPAFIQQNGPVRVARFRRNPDGTPDGGVHNLFVITGRTDAPAACQIKQPDFTNANNLSLRIPTPTFGLGLIEAIGESALRDNLASNATARNAAGVRGRFNTNGNDGTITRFGWKAQNKSLLLFSGEAYNVEVGVTNELFPQEREEDANCVSTSSPEDHANVANGTPGDIDLQAFFMRALAPPTPSATNPSIDNGRRLFAGAGCALCHTPSLKTGASSLAALSAHNVNLYSDLAIHRMGQNLADGVTQGLAQGDEWRTAPLWGLGDRIFLLHDGRTKDLLDAIRQHDSQGSEAHGVVANFQALTAGEKQDVLNFLRSL